MSLNAVMSSRTKELANLIRQSDATIVVYGIDYDHNHGYDSQVFGVSDLDKTLPAKRPHQRYAGRLFLPTHDRHRRATEQGSLITTYTSSGR